MVASTESAHCFNLNGPGLSSWVGFGILIRKNEKFVNVASKVNKSNGMPLVGRILFLWQQMNFVSWWGSRQMINKVGRLLQLRTLSKLLGSHRYIAPLQREQNTCKVEPIRGRSISSFCTDRAQEHYVIKSLRSLDNFPI